MNYYPNYMNPYFQYRPTQFQTQQPVQQPINQQYQQPIQPVQSNTPTISLQGKLVDSLDMVKTVEFPYDGSISYFPLTDGSAIVTKQLQMDGTTKTIVYKPVEMNEKDDLKSETNSTEISKQIESISHDNEDFRKSIDYIEKQVTDLSNNFKEFLENNVKGGKK